MLHVFYSANQQVDINLSFSPSAGKPKKVLEDWKKKGFPIKVHDFEPLCIQDISLAHDENYVKGVLNLEIENGFGNKNKAVAESLPWTTGSFCRAAEYALENKTQAVSLTSGFHHAHYDHGGGFCTFNGLMISAQYLKRKNPTLKIGVLDLDQHYGDGTDSIIKHLRLDYISHYTLGGHMWSNNTIELFFEQLPFIFETKFRDVDIMFVQLGADSCIEDPLGGLFTVKQMRMRDKLVFQLCKKYNLPLVWNLAGGYQKKFENVLQIHRKSAKEHQNIFCEFSS